MVSPTEVLKHKGPTPGIFLFISPWPLPLPLHRRIIDRKQYIAGFLCPLSANVYGIDFLEFQIRDMETKKIIFHVKRDKEAEAAAGVTFDPDDDSVRFIKYDFGADFLKLKTIGARYTFLFLGYITSKFPGLAQSSQTTEEEDRNGWSRRKKKGGCVCVRWGH